MNNMILWVLFEFNVIRQDGFLVNVRVHRSRIDLEVNVLRQHILLNLLSLAILNLSKSMLARKQE